MVCFARCDPICDILCFVLALRDTSSERPEKCVEATTRPHTCAQPQDCVNVVRVSSMHQPCIVRQWQSGYMKLSICKKKRKLKVNTRNKGHRTKLCNTLAIPYNLHHQCLVHATGVARQHMLLVHSYIRVYFEEHTYIKWADIRPQTFNIFIGCTIR